MKKYILIISLFWISCNNDPVLSVYEDYLAIEFPKEMHLVAYDKWSDFQDYNNIIVYELNYNSKRDLISNISSSLSLDSNAQLLNGAWVKSGSDYQTVVSDSARESGYYIHAKVTSLNELCLLIIEEVKL